MDNFNRQTATNTMMIYPYAPQEECGIFGIVAPHKDISRLIYYGLYALQHRGQESAGIATFNYDHMNIYKKMGLVSNIFTQEILKDIQGQIGIGHTRYSTTGKSTLENAQPILVKTKEGPIAFAHNGNLVNTNEIREMILKEDCKADIPSSDSHAIANLIKIYINQGKNLMIATKEALSHCKGAYSIVIASDTMLLAARCQNAIRPLSLGIIDNNNYVIASETAAFDIIGAKYLRDLKPGEILSIDKHGHLTSHFLEGERQEKLCVFELIYFARPDSIMYGHTNYSYRLKFGELLADSAPVDADIVLSVPDSGTPSAIGFANRSKIPYVEGLVKNRYVGRTFIEPTQEMRDLGIKIKLNPMRDIIDGKRVVLVDDSIVRGTSSKKIVELLRLAGAREVHVRISSPPVIGPCYYGIDTDNTHELIASRKTLQEIQEFIHADSLAYLSYEDLFKAIGLKNKNFCSSCLDLNYIVPINQTSDKTVTLTT